MPNIHINYMTILYAVIANFVLGFLWYTPLFGKIWAKELGLNTDQKPPASALIKGMVFMVIGNFFMAFVFAHNMGAWDPLCWGKEASAEPMFGRAMMAAIFTWLGFYVPTDLSTVAWEGKSWKLFFINTTYHLLTLIVAGLLIMYNHAYLAN